MPNLIVPTEKQQIFIDNWDKSILLQACVGTGKTFSLALRVSKAIENGILPEKILCVTFTNRAAIEMRERIKKQCPIQAHKVVIKTFHSFCAQVLYQSAKKVGIPQDFGIFDDDDSLDLIANLNLPEYLNLPERDICSLIQNYKIDRVEPTLGRTKPENFLSAFNLYQNQLRAYSALDFADLIACVNYAFKTNPLVQREWSKRFLMIQVDEMQDTHLAEYNIIAFLARYGHNLVLSGDFDQTIYEWRGSRPQNVIKRFTYDFPRHLTINFDENHRATKTLIEAACAVVATYSHNPFPKPAEKVEVGSPIIIKSLANEFREAAWIAEKIKQLHNKGVGYSQIGVLTRSNKRATVVSEALEKSRIPHLNAEKYQFFQRKEVKDCLSYLKFILNPEDQPSFRRLLRSVARDISPEIVKNIQAAETESSGLCLSDFGSITTLLLNEPYAILLKAFESGSVIVFDSETTGLDPKTDEIVELAAYKILNGRVVEKFHRFIKPSRLVGESFYIHGFSDDYLEKNGQDAKLVLSDFDRFSANSVLVGHNVRFDLEMVEANSYRQGISFKYQVYYDTLIIAKRFLQESSYRLQDLADSLNLPHKPSHQAEADLAATWDLLNYLVPLIKITAPKRQSLVRNYAKQFRPLALQLDRWKRLLKETRPHELLIIALQESGLFDFYKNNPRQMASLDELVQTFIDRDDPKLHPRMALDSILKFAALAKNIDRIDLEDRVAVITVHQAKGLEFEVVFMPGLTEKEFPNYYALVENKELEERRVFYVGLTRAKKQLFLSYYQQDDYNFRIPSRYLRLIPKESIEQTKTGSE